MTNSCDKKTILVIGLDTIRQKNLYQLIGLLDRGYRFVVITTDWNSTSLVLTCGYGDINVRVAKLMHVRRDFLSLTIDALRRDKISLVELYPYSLLGFLCALLVKAWRKPLLIIARGEEWYYLTKEMSRSQRIWFRLTYALADGVLYKETYMRDLLDTWGIKRRWLLPNAIDLPKIVRQQKPDECHFIFLNSIKTFRHPEIPLSAFLELCAERGLRGNSLVRMSVVGFLNEKTNPLVDAKETQLRSMIAGLDVPVEYGPWTATPEHWLDRADVFLLPADVVYVNYALLEAMGRGMPAIIQDAPNADLLVTDGEDGYILPLDKDVWKEKMAHFIDDASLRARMGASARRKIAEHYSTGSYHYAYDCIYKNMLRQQTIGTTET